MKTITYNPETHVLVPREPSQDMIDAMPPVEEIGYWAMYEAAIAAAPQPEQVESEPVPDFRGYAALGTGQYLLNACPATEDLPAELVISIATEEEKADRVIGDLKVVEPGTEIDPSSMAVRLAFFSVSGLDALEQQLHILREESFSNTTPQPDRTAELEAALKVARDDIHSAKLDGDTKVVAALIRVARAAWYAADDSEEVLTDYGRAHQIIGPDFDALSDALDALDELPDEQIAHLSLTDLLEKENVQLEAALKVAIDGIDEFLVANDPTEFGCACDLSVGYLCGPCHADKQQQPLKSALAKINKVLHD